MFGPVTTPITRPDNLQLSHTVFLAKTNSFFSERLCMLVTIINTITLEIIICNRSVGSIKRSHLSVIR